MPILTTRVREDGRLRTFFSALQSGLLVPSTTEFLVVGGGGAGSIGYGVNYAGGGGGGGRYIYGNNFQVTPGVSYSIVIGAGGVPDNRGEVLRNGQGGNSILGTIVALGGGHGGQDNNDASPKNRANNGGSGGGGGTIGINGSAGGLATTMFPSPFDGIGHNGGSGWSGTGGGSGGGGGADADGSSATTTAGGNGGAGHATTFAEAGNVTYASGGGGAGTTTQGTGGTGAGNGAKNANGGNATGYGCGGGGVFNTSSTDWTLTGGAGYKGIVIIKYPAIYNDPTTYTNGSKLVANGFKVFTWIIDGVLIF